MADETVIGQYAAQVGVPFEHDAEQVEGLAFIPVGGGPTIDERVDDREVVVGAKAAQAQPPVVGGAQQVRHDSEATALVGAFAVALVVDAAEVDERVEAQALVVAQALADGKLALGVDFDRSLRQGRASASGSSRQAHPAGRPASGPGAWSSCDRARAADLVLQLDDSVQQRLRGGRASGHVDIHRHDAVTASDHRIGIVVVAAAVGA